MLATIGLQEILVIVLLMVLLFGSTQIPKVARAIGEGLKELKKGIREAKGDDESKNEEKPDRADKPGEKKKDE
jgi:sec-independent protein translocase protein TatA